MSFSQTISTDYYNEPHRPQFHFSPESNWMNDPNGLVYYKGKYHLFYQYYPEYIVWGPMHWGHASSADLFHWEHHPIALYPDSLGNIFSGCTVIDKNNMAGFGKNAMIAIFTYHNDSLWAGDYRNTETQGLAYSLDEGLTWTKYKNNPVIHNSGEKDFRDPKVFWHDGTDEWTMVLAAGDRIKIFASSDLKAWKFKSDFRPEPDMDGPGVWECPDLFSFSYNDEKKWVMIVSRNAGAPNGGSGTRYFVGDFDGEVFTNTQPARWLDYGTDNYAGVTFSNVPGNKKILIAWMSNWLYAEKTPTRTWRGAMTLPRALTPGKDETGYYLRQSVAGGFGKLKTETLSLPEMNTPFAKSGLNLDQAEIRFDLPGQTADIKISNVAGEFVQVKIMEKQVTINRSQSGMTSFSEEFSSGNQTMPINEPITNIQLILDRASMEMLLNDGKYTMTIICFPNKKYAKLDIKTASHGKPANLKISEIKNAWQ